MEAAAGFTIRDILVVNPAPEEADGLSDGEIAGIVIGVVIAALIIVALLILLIYCCWRYVVTANINNNIMAIFQL